MALEARSDRVRERGGQAESGSESDSPTDSVLKRCSARNTALEQINVRLRKRSLPNREKDLPIGGTFRLTVTS